MSQLRYDLTFPAPGQLSWRPVSPPGARSALLAHRHGGGQVAALEHAEHVHERGLAHGQPDRHGDVLVAAADVDRLRIDVVDDAPVDQQLLDRARDLGQLADRFFSVAGPGVMVPIFGTLNVPNIGS